MRWIRPLLLGAIALAVTAPAAAATCESLRSFTIPQGTITATELVAAGPRRHGSIYGRSEAPLQRPCARVVNDGNDGAIRRLQFGTSVPVLVSPRDHHGRSPAQAATAHQRQTAIVSVDQGTPWPTA